MSQIKIDGIFLNDTSKKETASTEKDVSTKADEGKTISAMTVTELRVRAKEKGIKGYST